LLVRLFADLQKLSESDREKKPSERALRVQELVTSERDYIEDIRIVVAQFKVPLILFPLESKLKAQIQLDSKP
jgi:hypothetical protein